MSRLNQERSPTASPIDQGGMRNTSFTHVKPQLPSEAQTQHWTGNIGGLRVYYEEILAYALENKGDSHGKTAAVGGDQRHPGSTARDKLRTRVCGAWRAGIQKAGVQRPWVQRP
jgi:hypothetical protein